MKARERLYALVIAEQRRRIAAARADLQRLRTARSWPSTTTTSMQSSQTPLGRHHQVGHAKAGQFRNLDGERE